jgi:hypothetical protein
VNYHKNGLEFNIIANYCSPLQIFQCTDGFNHSPFLALPTLLARQRGEPGKIIIVIIIIIIIIISFGVATVPEVCKTKIPPSKPLSPFLKAILAPQLLPMP